MSLKVNDLCYNNKDHDYVSICKIENNFAFVTNGVNIYQTDLKNLELV